MGHTSLCLYTVDCKEKMLWLDQKGLKRVTRGFADLFSRQAPFNLLWRHLRTKTGTAAQLEPGFNVEELVLKRLKTAVGH